MFFQVCCYDIQPLSNAQAVITSLTTLETPYTQCYLQRYESLSPKVCASDCRVTLLVYSVSTHTSSLLAECTYNAFLRTQSDHTMDLIVCVLHMCVLYFP